MAITYIEGFDKYGPSFSAITATVPGAPVVANMVRLLQNEWTGNTGVYIGPPLSTNGGSGCAPGSAGTIGFTKTFTSNFAKAIGGVRFQTASTSNNVSATIVVFSDSGTRQGGINVNMSTGSIIVTNAAGTAVTSGTFTGVISLNQTHYLEWNLTMGSSAAWQIWLDGVSLGTGTGANFHGSANNTYNQLFLGTAGNGVSVAGPSVGFDDLYVDDGAGAPLLTNPIVETKFETSDSSVAFTSAAQTVGFWNCASAAGVNPGTNITAAGLLFLRKFTAPGNCTLNSVSMCPTTTGAAKYKAVLYADSAGSPAALTATGAEVSGVVSGTVITSAFGSGQSLTSGTAYWIGFITDTGSSTIAAENAGTTGWGKSNTYASGAPNPAGTAALTNTFNFTIWGNVVSLSGNWYVESSQMPPAAWGSDFAYTTSHTVNDEDLFGMGALSTTPTNIYAVSVKAYMKDSAAGARTVTIRTKSSTVDDPGSNAGFTPATTYGWFVSTWLVDPNTSAAWTASNLNAALTGYKITA